jgi:very-short-patch-repair endonuclease
MDVTDVLRALGGSARWSELNGRVGWRALKEAELAGAVRHDGAAWSLLDTADDIVLARQLRAVRSHATAAAHWRLALPPQNDAAVHLTVRWKAHRRGGTAATLHYRDLADSEIDGDVTTPLRTVVDCLREESLRVALSVGDSALATGLVTAEQLREAVDPLRGPHSRKAKDRLCLLDARAANAFESSMRAILIAAGILGFQPQVNIRKGGKWVGRVDLAHRGLRIVIECDGFDTHGGREAFVTDLVRHTELTAAGWRTLRFTWEQVMFHPEWVLEQVRLAIAAAIREGKAA